MAGVKHHLLDIVTPDSDFSAAEFASLARKKVQEIKNQGKNIIIAGGSWFYITSFLNEELMPNIGINKELREQLSTKTPDELWQILFELDSVRANQVHKNNKDKVIRSIEMCKGLNMPVSEFKTQKTSQIRAKWFMPNIEREELYERINKRVDIMIEQGLFDEWQRNSVLYPNSKVLKNTIGYKEFFELKDGLYGNFDEAVEKIKQRTRNFAKRQLTYFRSNPEITAINNVQEIIETLKFN